MENVIQKYLRNEFETIEEYNAMAGEVAEPFRVLVVANFPDQLQRGGRRAGWRPSPPAACRCGVYARSPSTRNSRCRSGFGSNDLRPHCVHLTWKDRTARLGRPRFRPRIPLILDPPPPAEFATR